MKSQLVDILAESDLTEREYQHLESLLWESGRFDDQTLFRARMRRIAQILIVQTAYREGATNKRWQKLTDRLRNEIQTLGKARSIVKDDQVLVDGLSRHIDRRGRQIRTFEKLPTDSRKKDELKYAVENIIETFAHHTGRLPSDLSPGAHSADDANLLCRFVLESLKVMQVNLTHDRVWDLVRNSFR